MIGKPLNVVLFSAAGDPVRWQQAVEIRFDVFVTEQGVPITEELDSHDTEDPTCVHALAETEGRAVATGRIYEPADGAGKIGRMAVAAGFRGIGAGMAILDALIKEATRRELRSLTLDAQVPAVGFYAKRGFQAVGPVFLDCGIPHQAMRLAL